MQDDPPTASSSATDQRLVAIAWPMIGAIALLAVLVCAALAVIAFGSGPGAAPAPWALPLLATALVATLALAVAAILRTRSAMRRFAREIERDPAELRLFEEKERAQVTLASIADAVITVDTDARIEYLNPVAERLTGWRNAEAR
ncbi:MAG: PAS domain-containing protein, partial [Candidatus Levyibacteriota bacterium]